MRGAVQRLVEAPLAERILSKEIAPGAAVRVEPVRRRGLSVARPTRTHSGDGGTLIGLPADVRH